MNDKNANVPQNQERQPNMVTPVGNPVAPQRDKMKNFNEGGK